jgi:transcriptional regulator with XRE-family HTH domain
MSTREWEAACALGARLRSLRKSAGLSQAALGSLAEMGERHVRRLEHGERRTRETTLERIAVVLTRAQPSLGDAHAVLAGLLRLGGVAIAAESDYRDRVDRRRVSRTRKRRQREVIEHMTRWVHSPEGVVEVHEHSWPDGGRRLRRRSFMRAARQEC